MICPLCQSSNNTLFFQGNRDFLQCSDCLLVFVPPKQFLSPEKEKRVYDLHENCPDDVGYRHFLERIFIPLSQNIAPQSDGLDFGSGPGPTLSLMFAELGHVMTIYDPFYAPDKQCFKHHYDFISASEVVEHLHYPGDELNRLWSCLKDGGILGIMTKRVIDKKAFSNWHYKHDPTHVCFFSVATFQWLAQQWKANLMVVDKDVVLFKKSVHDDFI
ncbi:MAG: class I SAM-dependent methyltransferase [gamma proteobacterium symbiont of Taylorina sp.]|nr:class I SAM-dependent methyltransferase [gamma proteobacterium symbiont of Taylorina sp.]